MDVHPAAAPYAGGHGDTGVLLCHGFTGSPAALRPWAEHLTAAGLRVELPRLPGHGTSWQALNRTGWQDWYAAVERSLHRLSQRCSTVLVAGLSMGGALALRLAQTEHDRVNGLILVNPAIHDRNRLLPLLPLLCRIVPSLPAIGDDIRRPGATEYAYDRMPLRALDSLTRFWRLVHDDLPLVDQPVLLFHSVVDHVVDASGLERIRRSISSRYVEEQQLGNSYHVATLDHDAPMIFAESVRFAARVVPTTATTTLTGR